MNALSGQDGIAMKYVFRILAMISNLLAFYAIWLDLTSTFSASASLGRLWYSHNPGSLQVSEAIISRFIDPCGLIIALNCSTFLWHPIIATILGWPAALVLLALSIIFWLLSKMMGNSKFKHTTRASTLRRSGDR